MLNKGINLVELSSFMDSPLQGNHKLRNCYFKVNLPVSTQKFCRALVRRYFIMKEKENSWPGRRAPSLSPLVSGQ